MSNSFNFSDLPGTNSLSSGAYCFSLHEFKCACNVDFNNHFSLVCSISSDSVLEKSVPKSLTLYILSSVFVSSVAILIMAKEGTAL